MLKNSLIALQGTLIAQGIGFAFLPLLTRAYTPEQLGSYQVYLSVFMLVIIAASLRYELALLNAEKGCEERAVLRLCGALNLASGVLVFTATGLLFVTGSVLALRLLSEVSLFLLAVGVLAGGLFQTLGYVVLREQVLGINAAAKITQVALFCLLALAAGHLSTAGQGLIASDVASRFCAAALIVAWMLRNRRHYFDTTPIASVVKAARTFSHYPFYAVPSGLLTATLGTIVPLLVLVAFGESVMGQYALVQRAVLMPAGLIGQSIAQAFTAELSAAVVSGKSPVKEFKRLVYIMGALGTVPAVVLFFFGQMLFEVVFGVNWIEAGSMAEIAGIMLITTMATSPVNMTLLILGYQKQQLAWEASRLGVIGLLWVMVVKYGIAPLTAIGLHAAATVIMDLVFLYLAHQALLFKRNNGYVDAPRRR